MTDATVTASPPPATLEDLLRDHDWDELIFGGYICLTCSPKEDEEGYGDPDTTIMWPCPPLRDAGLTDEKATEVVRQHYARIAEAARAAGAPLPQLDQFKPFDGITVGYVGDDGDIVALGWHHNPAEVLHAMDSLARHDGGIEGVYDDPDRKPDPDNLVRRWAVNTQPPGAEWCLEWGGEITMDTVGAFPVTVLVM
jgi:hypothetical protein